jgi:hypothetical protein
MPERPTVTMQLHLNEAALIDYLRRLGHGCLERLIVADGLPVGADEVRGKVRFDKGGEKQTCNAPSNGRRRFSRTTARFCVGLDENRDNCRRCASLWLMREEPAETAPAEARGDD